MGKEKALQQYESCECRISAQILSLPPWQIALLLLTVDGIFVATSYKFLDLAQAFDEDWHHSRKRYPGEASISSRGIPSCLILILPTVAMQASHPRLGLSTQLAVSCSLAFLKAAGRLVQSLAFTNLQRL